jgi:hypothetical protein
MPPEINMKEAWNIQKKMLQRRHVLSKKIWAHEGPCMKKKGDSHALKKFSQGGRENPLKSSSHPHPSHIHNLDLLV